MALIPTVGRKSPPMRLLVAFLYLILSVGAVTMVYPFLMMLGLSVESQYDQASFALVPRYLYSAPALFGKYAEDKYKADISSIGDAYGVPFAKLQDVGPPPGNLKLSSRAWDTFAASLPPRMKTVGFGGAGASYAPSTLLDRYHNWLRAHFHNNIAALNKSYTEEDDTFLTVFPPFEQPARRGWTPARTAKSADWAAFQQNLPARYFTLVGADPLYQRWLKEEAYASLPDLNHAWGTAYASYGAIILPAQNTQGNAAHRKDWETFVRTRLPFRDIQVAPSALPAYQQFLTAKYQSDIAQYNAQYQASLGAFRQIALPNSDRLPASGPPLLDWLDFLKSAAPAASLSVDTPETRWRAAHVAPLSLAQAVYISDWAYARTHQSALRWSFLTRNYSLVLQYIVLHGRAIFTTVVYCVLSVLTALIVNPLCAYALSRYNLSYGNAVLLFLLTTMAFPAEVALIPGFLLLKQLSLLNTFWALILPGAASGYSIFLLKGFFDSLPKELYEAGTLDGAGEMTLFRAITLPLSRPIFAVIALGAFTSAYGAFLFAMLTCQDKNMWTLMVWLYELQTAGAPQYVMMAGLALAAVPTLLVFILAQNTIMKGIILPSYK